MADATYVTPITQPARSGIRIERVVFGRTASDSHIMFSDVTNTDEIVLQTTAIVANVDEANPNANRDFVVAITTAQVGEPVSVLGKLNFRAIKYLTDRGVVSGLS